MSRAFREMGFRRVTTFRIFPASSTEPLTPLSCPSALEDTLRSHPCPRVSPNPPEFPAIGHPSSPTVHRVLPATRRLPRDRLLQLGAAESYGNGRSGCSGWGLHPHQSAIGQSRHIQNPPPGSAPNDGLDPSRLPETGERFQPVAAGFSGASKISASVAPLKRGWNSLIRWATASVRVECSLSRSFA
jgi:hypothetical protein